MSFSILRVEKVKGSNNTKGIQKHCQRENNHYQNPDIDSAKTSLNYDLINKNNINYQQVIDEKIDAGYTGNRKIRSDAIRHVDGIITSDDLFFERVTPGERREFFEDSLKFLENEYGKENMIYATVHVDEKTPHMHFGFVPLTEDGRLSAKERLGNKKALTDLQDRFNEYLNEEGYDLERGISKEISQAEHKEMAKLKKETDYHREQFEETSQKYVQMNTQYENLVEEYSKGLEMLNEDIEFDYENEVHQEKNIFGKVVDEKDTGRKIINADDFEKIQDRFTSASRLIHVYEELTNQDFYKENQRLKEEKEDIKDTMLLWKEEYQKSSSEVKKLRNENEGLKDKNRNLENEVEEKDKAIDGLINHSCTIYKTLRNRFKGFEEAYSDFSNTLAQKERTKPVSHFMDNIQQTVHVQDKKRSRSHDLEL